MSECPAPQQHNEEEERQILFGAWWHKQLPSTWVNFRTACHLAFIAGGADRGQLEAADREIKTITARFGDAAKALVQAGLREQGAELDRNRLEALVQAFPAKDAEGLARVCMAFATEMLHKQDDIGQRFWTEQARQLLAYAALAAEKKPALKSVDNNDDLVAYENLERNPPGRRATLATEAKPGLVLFPGEVGPR